MSFPHSSTEIANRIATLRSSFAVQVPMHLHTLRRLYDELGNSNWEAGKLTALLENLREFAGSATTFGFDRIREVSRSMERELQAIQSGVLPPDSERRAKANDLFKTLLALPVPDPTLLTTLRPPRLDGSREEIEQARRLIYVVDHDSQSTGPIAEQMRYFGYAVETFNRLDTFAAAYRQRPPAAVVLGIEFPGEQDSGPSMAGQLMYERGESTPAVIISNNDDIQSRLSAARAGSDRYLLKPIIIGELIDAIDSLLDTALPTPYRVLIIDDSQAISQLYAGLLEDAGMKVEFSTNPLKALDIISAFQPDVALLDIYMPQCSGQELATVIRQFDANVSLPIVFLSAETDRARQVTALQLGADDFLTKPVQPDFLIASIATRAARARQMRGLMQRDSLTGLLNHSNFVLAASTELARSQRSKTAMSIAMIDIDNFRQINENYGPTTGDRVLRSIARQLRQRLRCVDAIGRYGGEEFGVVFSGAEARTALQVINAIRDDFSRIEHSTGRQTFHATFSAGIACSTDFDDISKLLKASNRGLTEAKRRGRNTAVLATPLAANASA